MEERKTRIVSFSVAESSPKTQPVLENEVLQDPEGAGCVWRDFAFEKTTATKSYN